MKTTTNDPQPQPYSVQQQPPPSASEQVWCPACERTHPPADPAPSTGATAGGELDAAEQKFRQDEARSLTWEHGYAFRAGWLARDAEVAQLRSAKGAWHEAEADAERAREYARECEQGWRQANAELNTLRSDLGLVSSQRDTYRERCDRMAEVIKTLDSDLAHAQAELERIHEAMGDADVQAEYRAICMHVTEHGYLNAPMSERARQLLHRLKDAAVERDQLRAQVQALRGCQRGDHDHLHQRTPTCFDVLDQAQQQQEVRD